MQQSGLTAISLSLCVIFLVEFSSCVTFHEHTVANQVSYDAQWIDKRASDIVDIVFVIDESGSVGPTNFDRCKEFVRNFLDYFSVAPGHSQVGLVKFGNVGTSSILLRADSDKCSLMKELDAVRFASGATNAYDGLNKALLMIKQFGRKKAYQNVLQVVVFMTDGDWNNGGDPAPIVNQLKAEGVLVMVILVGHVNRRNEMIGWSSLDVNNKPMAFELSNFDSFAAVAHYIHKGSHSSKFLTINAAECGNRCNQPSSCKCDSMANRGQPTCACEPGYYQIPAPGNKLTCGQCPNGQYQHEINMNAYCRSCPAMQTTISPGSTASSQCVCGQGFWNPSDQSNKPPCSAVTCGKESQLSMDQHNLALKGTCGYMYGNTCDYTCLAGYITTGVTKRTCLQSGNMDPPLPQCHSLQCPIPPVTPHSTGWDCQLNGQSTSGSYPYKTMCASRCQPGYRKQLGTTQSMICSQDSTHITAKWSGKPLVCEPVPCTALPVVPNGQYNHKKCDEPNAQRTFGDECFAVCNTGFVASADVKWVCQADGSWTNVDQSIFCKDVRPPTILKCPQHVELNNHEGTDYTEVKLVPPEAIDNYRNDELETTLTLQLPGLTESTYTCSKDICGSATFKFPIGDSKVKFTVADRSGNEAECGFQVSVKDIEPPTVVQCSGPVTEDGGFIYTDQPEANVQWAEPQFRDNSNQNLTIYSTSQPGYYKVGQRYTINYSATDSAGLMAKCEFTFKVSGMKCPELHVPHNGAMVCDTLAFGVYCMPQCQKGLQRLLPDDVPFAPREYLCTNEGKWRPMDVVGDCSIRSSIDDGAELELTYEGDCNDETTQQQIIQNTIKALNSPELGYWKGQAFKDAHGGDLTTDHFEVKCGPRNESIIMIGGGGRYRRNVLFASAILGSPDIY